jgi:hypothetical protein
VSVDGSLGKAFGKLGGKIKLVGLDQVDDNIKTRSNKIEYRCGG